MCRKKESKYAIPFGDTLELTGLPVVTFYQGDKKFNFLLDSGAARNLINVNILDEFEHTKGVTRKFGYGVDGKAVPLGTIFADIYYQGRKFTEKFRTMDLTASTSLFEKENNIPIHGLLSSSFFSKYNYILDYSKNIAYPQK